MDEIRHSDCSVALDAPVEYLRAPRELLGYALAHVGDGVITTDKAGCVNSLNAVAETLTGWPLGEAVGKNIGEILRLVDEQTREPIPLSDQTGSEGKPPSGRLPHAILIARDGSKRPVDARAAAIIHDDRAAVVGVVHIFRDIVGLRKSERRIESARRYAQGILKTVRGPHLVLDPQLHVVAASRSFYETFQVEPAEVDGRSVYAIGDGQWNSSKLRVLLESIIPTNSAFDNFEVEHDFERIGRKTMLLNARRFPPDGDNDMLLLAFEDVTDRKRLSDAVAISEVRYRRLFEEARDGILLIEPDTQKIVDANPFMSELLGHARADLVGKELWEIGLLRDEQNSRATLAELRRTGFSRYESLPLQSKGGTRREVEFVSNLYHEGGRPIIQCNIRDITERKRAEETLSNADRRKDDFLATLAHELRNPLAPIRSAVEVMRLKGSGDGDVQWARAVVERQVQQLTLLVDDILDMSRISRGKINLHLEPVKLASVASRAVEISRPLIEARKQHLEILISVESVEVEGDATRLTQILVNLLNNAAKYTEERGRIQLSVEASVDDAILRVRDSGVGLAANMLARIFDMFTQVEGSVNRSQGGLGIGLSLVRSLVEMHGGNVQAFSEGLARGSEFVVRLPRLQRTPNAGPECKPRESTRKAQPRRILLVDDNLDAAECLAMLLRLIGHEVLTALDGPTALDSIRNDIPDVVLLDIGLPIMDGLEVAQRIRKDLGLKDVLLVALTGYGQDADRQRSMEAGFNAYLVKPVNLDDLEALLARPEADAPGTRR